MKIENSNQNGMTLKVAAKVVSLAKYSPRASRLLRAVRNIS